VGECNEGTNLIFGRPVLSSLLSLHPQPVQIFQLWQTFLDNVNPLTKLLHAPTVQQLVLGASGYLENLPTSIEALMFSIYHCAVMSMTSEDCETVMGEPRATLLTKYSTALQQALANAKLLKTTNLMVLQAFALYLVGLASVINLHVSLVVAVTHEVPTELH
jgi:hypothetical protein